MLKSPIIKFKKLVLPKCKINLGRFLSLVGFVTKVKNQWTSY